MIYRPRMHARLVVPFRGVPLERIRQVDDSTASVIDLRLRRAELETNDHNHADSLKVHAAWGDVEVDPRLLKDATIYFYLGTANESGYWAPDESNLRFVGTLVRARRSLSETAADIELEFHDYTAHFLATKPFVSAGVPDYSQTLRDAWRRICDHVGPSRGGSVISLVPRLRDNIEFRGVDGDTRLGRAVAERFSRLTRVPVKANTDAWAVWQQCVGMLGLITFIRRETCIVTTSTEHYSSETAPRLVWGRNVLSLEETVEPTLVKGVAITSFDPLSGTTCEAFWPPLTELRVKRLTVPPRRRETPAAVTAADYEFFEYHGVTDLEVLQEIARRAYDERSRQELQGTLRTAEMFVESLDHSFVDIIDLAAGDNVRVEIGLDLRSALAALKSDVERVRHLEDLGYASSVAQVAVRNLKVLGMAPTFHTKRVLTTLAVDGDGGEFSVEIAYHNRIDVRGGADDSVT